MRNIVRRELEDCRRAIVNGDTSRARTSLDKAISKLKDLDSKVKRLERAARDNG